MLPNCNLQTVVPFPPTVKVHLYPCQNEVLSNFQVFVNLVDKNCITLLLFPFFLSINEIVFFPGSFAILIFFMNTCSYSLPFFLFIFSLLNCKISLYSNKINTLCCVTTNYFLLCHLSFGSIYSIFLLLLSYLFLPLKSFRYFTLKHFLELSFFGF